MAYNFLIVDDSPPMRTVLKRAIGAAGFSGGEVAEASDGKSALEILKRRWIDLVLTDFNMPVMNGMELIAAMKADSTLGSIPVVVITTEGSDERVRAILGIGAAQIIRKPFTVEQIRSTLFHLLGVPENEEGSLDQGDENLDF